MNTVTSLLHESRHHWIHDPHPNQPPRVTPRQAVSRNNNDTVPRNNHNTVPRNTSTVNKSDAHSRAPLGTISSASWYNSSLPLSSAPSPRKNVCKPVPRNNIQQKGETVQVRNEASTSSLPPKKKRDRKHRRERRARERENTSESFIHDARWANQCSLVPGSSVFQWEWPSQSLRPSTPYRPCGRQCTRLPNLSVTQQPMKIRRSK